MNENTQDKTLTMEIATENTSYEPAGFWIRLVATIIDIFMLYIIQIPFVFMIGLVTNLEFSKIMAMSQNTGELPPEFASLGTIMFVTSTGVSLFYYWGFYTWKCATVGKLIFGLRVYKLKSDSPIGLGGVILREFIGKFLSAVIFMFGYIIAGFRSDKRALHDFIAGSRVVKVRD